jgi:hypothetical protein
LREHTAVDQIEVALLELERVARAVAVDSPTIR